MNYWPKTQRTTKKSFSTVFQNPRSCWPTRGLDTSVILRWLREDRLRCHAFVQIWARRSCIIRQNRHVEGPAKSMWKISGRNLSQIMYFHAAGNAVYESSSRLLPSPLIATNVAVNWQKGGSHVSHGATGRATDQVRSRTASRRARPHAQVIASWRNASMASREDPANYASSVFLFPSPKPKLRYKDLNLFHQS